MGGGLRGGRSEAVKMRERFFEYGDEAGVRGGGNRRIGKLNEERYKREEFVSRGGSAVDF